MTAATRWRSIFDRMDAGPWVCPVCDAEVPWYRAPTPERRALIAKRPLIALGGVLGYGDGSTRCLCCFTDHPPATPEEGTPA